MEVQLAKAPSPKVFTEFGRVIAARDVQPKNALAPMVWRVSGNETFVSAV